MIVVNFALGIVGLTMVFFGALYAIAAQAVAAGTCLTGGIVLTLLATIDRFESIKGLGVEAKARKLDATITNAEDTLKRLREVAEMFGAATMRTASQLGRYDAGLSLADAYALSRTMQDQMVRLGSSPDVVRRMLEPWVTTTAWDGMQHVIADYWTAYDGFRAKLEIELATHRMARTLPDPAKVELFDKMKDGKQSIRDRIEKKPTLEAWQEICAEPDRWPALPIDARNALRAKIATWDPEIRFLVERADLRTPSMWFRIG